MLSGSTYGISLAGMAWLLLACAPPASKGQCTQDADCTGRGQICNVEDSICEEIPFAPESTRDPTPATFSDEPAPFFRGTVCTVTAVQPGDSIPITVTPCLHPCLEEASRRAHHRSYRCSNGVCEGWAAVWLTVDSMATGCTENPFGQFDRSLCVWDESVSFSMNVKVGGQPVTGTLSLELPYLSNDDLRNLPADPTPDQIEDAINAYPPLDDRIVGPITMNEQNPAAPTTCEGSNDCECSEIGF